MSEIVLWNAVLIFGLRLVDVSIGTVRLMMIGRGQRTIAPVLGFVEITIWVVAISSVITNLDNIVYIIAYSGGFAAGTLIGMWIEDKLSVGQVRISVFSLTQGSIIAQKLRESDYGVTELTGNGQSGSVDLITTIIPRRDTKKVFGVVNQMDPQSFVVVDDMRLVERGHMHIAK